MTKDYFQHFNTLNMDTSHFQTSNDICTPMECVKEMVDLIPDDFWLSNPKVLDPCCGNGNFPAYICHKFPDPEYALKNNIFMNEINPKRVENLRNYFGEEINLTTRDFFEFPFYEKYDLISANPPYAKITDGKRAAKNHGISKDFIKKALSILNPNGYLLFIVPDNFMSLSDSNDTFEILSRYNLIHLNIGGAKKYFKGVGSSFVYFLLQKTKDKTETTIENFNFIKDTQKVLIERTEYLPLYYSSLVKSIFDKTINANNIKLKVETSSNLHATTQKKFLSSSPDKDHPYRILHTFKETKYSSIPHKYQDGWKCFISLTSYFETKVDDCGMTQSIAFIRCPSKEEAERISNLLSHPLYRFLNNLCRYGNFNNIRIIQKMPDCIGDPYEIFGITEDEKLLIENNTFQHF